MSGMAIGVVGALVLGWAELANIWTGTANGPAARSTALRSRMDTDRRRPRALALARALSRRSRRRGGRGARSRCSRRGSDRGRRGRGVRGAHARLDRTVAAATGLRRRGEASRSSSCRCSPARPLPEPCCCRRRRIRDTLRWSHRAGEYPGIKPAWTDPLAHGIEVARRDGRRPAARRSLRHLRSRRNQPRSRQPRRNRAPVRKHPSRSIWFYVVAAILLVVLVLAALIAARLLSTRFAWRRVRRRLAAGAPRRPGHRRLGLDANAAGSVPAAAGRRRLARRGRRRASDGRRPGRRLHAAAGARGERRRKQPFHASNR